MTHLSKHRQRKVKKRMEWDWKSKGEKGICAKNAFGILCSKRFFLSSLPSFSLQLQLLHQLRWKKTSQEEWVNETAEEEVVRKNDSFVSYFWSLSSLNLDYWSGRRCCCRHLKLNLTGRSYTHSSNFASVDNNLETKKLGHYNFFKQYWTYLKHDLAFCSGKL